MTARVLLVEDEPAMARGLVELLKARQYHVELVTRGDHALDRILESPFDLILLDVMLPVLSGFEILRLMRQAKCKTPVILLTAKGAESDKVLGFELGTDDYVTKPFSPMELLGRISAVIRRTAAPLETVPSLNALDIGKTKIDFKAYVALQGSERHELPTKCFDILRVLAKTPGVAVSRDQLMDAVWGEDEYISQRTLNNLIVKIRQAIEPDAGEPCYLKTVHGVGYRLDL